MRTTDTNDLARSHINACFVQQRHAVSAAQKFALWPGCTCKWMVFCEVTARLPDEVFIIIELSGEIAKEGTL